MLSLAHFLNINDFIKRILLVSEATFARFEEGAVSFFGDAGLLWEELSDSSSSTTKSSFWKSLYDKRTSQYTTSSDPTP